MDRVFFTNSGAEAIEGALKAARKYAYTRDGSSGHEIIAMKHSFHGRTVGPGGFIDITQNAKKLCFMGTFTAGKEQDIAIEGDGLTIHAQGSQKKFLNEVEAITFSGPEAVRKGQEVLYITERAVFRLTDRGLVLTEIARGADLQRDILDQMEFAPVIPDEVPFMDARLFRDGPMGLKP